jgi:prophage regulatory protein
METWDFARLFFAQANPEQEIRQMAPRLISHDELKNKGIRYSKPHLWRLERAGKFPKRVYVGPGRYAYLEPEIDGHVEKLIAARDANLVVA